MSGCSNQSTHETSRYYLLHSNSESYQKAATTLTIGIAPIEVAEYLNTQGIALITQSNQIQFARYHLWAELPNRAIPRVLHSEIERALPHVGIETGRHSGASEWDYTLLIQIDQFHGSEQGDATLSGYWSLKDKDKILTKQRFNFSEKIDSPGYDPLVSKLRKHLSSLALEQTKTISEFIKDYKTDN